MGRMHSAVRSDTIKANLYQRRDRLEIESPYYVPVAGPHGAVLTVAAKDSHDTLVHWDSRMAAMGDDRPTILKSRIPCIRIHEVPSTNKKKKYQVAIARAYMAQRHALASTEYDKMELEAMFRAQHPGASDEIHDLFSERMDQTPLERMKIPEVEEDQLTEEWIRHHCDADVITNPVIGALQRVLRRACLGGPTSYMVWAEPPPIIITNQHGKTFRLSFHSLMQLMHIQPAPSDEPGLRITNTQRPTLSASRQLDMCVSSSERDPLEKKLASTMGLELDTHPSRMQLLFVQQELAWPANEFFNNLAREAGLTHDEPWAIPANVNRIAVMQRAWCIRHGLTDAASQMEYPFEDLRQIIQEARNEISGLHASGFAPLTGVLLSIPRPPEPTPDHREDAEGRDDADDDEDDDDDDDRMDLD
jgi:hypothetical protein